MKQPAIYILTNHHNNVFYIGVTSDLKARVWQHKNNCVTGFSQRYQTHKLVYFELFMDMSEAIRREKRLKNWKRAWKIELINQFNSEWLDLYGEL